MDAFDHDLGLVECACAGEQITADVVGGSEDSVADAAPGANWLLAGNIVSTVDRPASFAAEHGGAFGGEHDDGEDRSSALGKSTSAGTSADAAAALQRVGTDTSECSEVANRKPGEPCSSRRVVAAIEEFVVASAPESAASGDSGASSESTSRPLPKGGDDGAKAVRTAAKVLGCTSESCIVTHPKFRSFVREEGAGLAEVGGTRILDLELDRRFKTEGPRDSTQLLSNFNIDGVLQKWAAAHPKFFNFSFNMMDFEARGGSLARTDVAGILEGSEPQNLGAMGGVVRRPCDTFGCVLNTDVSSGRGKHWVAVFGDCRGENEWSVEYFNSAGNPPPPPVTRWLENSAARLAEFRAGHPRTYGTGAVVPVPLTDMRHQDSQTECGLYALYYIRRRLEGAPYTEFRDARIPDEAMVEFRKHVFRAK